MAVIITSPPPADVIDELSLVRAALGHVVPAKSPGNLLVGTWNIRDFDRVSPAWRSATGESPIRDLSNVVCIAEIVCSFDVVTIQEVARVPRGFWQWCRRWDRAGPTW
jgi:hypothetical protein